MWHKKWKKFENLAWRLKFKLENPLINGKYIVENTIFYYSSFLFTSQKKFPVQKSLFSCCWELGMWIRQICRQSCILLFFVLFVELAGALHSAPFVVLLRPTGAWVAPKCPMECSKRPNWRHFDVNLVPLGGILRSTWCLLGPSCGPGASLGAFKGL